MNRSPAQPEPPPTASLSAFPAPRVPPNATHACGGIFRLTARRFFTARHWLAVLGLLTVLAVFALGASSNADDVSQYGSWAALFYVCFLVPILAFISAAGTMRDDLKAGSVDYIFTRPVRRLAFVAFRYLAHVACAQLDFLLALGVVGAVGVFRGAPEMGTALPVLLLAQAMAVIVFGAFGFFCGLLTSRYVIVGLLYGLVVEVGVGSVPTQLSQVSMLRHIGELLRPVIGDEGINIVDRLVVTEPLSAPAAAALLLGIAAALIAATAALFNAKELAGQAGGET